MLAYVFWHVPAAAAASGYEERLAAFHAALREDAPEGLGPTATFALDAVPWLGAAPGYEDWYLVDDFAALGTLNVAAVSGHSRQPHDAAAAIVGPGIAGVMGHITGPLLPVPPRWAAWLAKPAGVAYGDFHEQLAAALPDGGCAWRRQMVLGPAAEYCVLAGAPLELPWPVVHAWPLRVAVATVG